MEFLKNEICKLLTKRAAVFFLLLIAANMLLQIYTMHTPGEDGYSLKDYSGAYRELDSCGRENLLSRLEERAAGADTFGKRNLYDRVYKEVLASLNYAEYLNSIEEKAEEAAILNRISHDDGYAVRNAEITRKVYSKLSGTKPEVEDTMGVLNITDNEITDYLLMVMLFVTAVNLVFREKDGNQFELLRTTQNGRRKLMRSKVFAMSVFVLLGIVSLYGINAAISRCFYAPIDYGSPLQSVPAYRYSPFALTIGSFLVCYFGIKTVSCILLGLLFMWICAVCGNIVFVFSASAAAVFAEILCYTKISGTHFLVFLKYINIQYGVRTGGMFSDYVNLRVWGYPVNTCFLYGIFWLVLITMLFILLQIIWRCRTKRGKCPCRWAKCGNILGVILLFFYMKSISCLFPAGAFLFCCVPACLQFGGIRQKKSVLHPLMKFIIKSTWINFTVLWTRKTVTE